MAIAYSGTPGLGGNGVITLTGAVSLSTLVNDITTSHGTYATINGNSILFLATLSIGTSTTTANFTAADCTMIFPGTYTITVPNNSAQSGTSTTFTDVGIIFDGSAKAYGNAINYGSHNWTRVVYRSQITSSRTDLFQNTGCIFTFSNVQLTVSSTTNGGGASDYIHFYNNATTTVTGVTVTGLGTSASSESFEVGTYQNTVTTFSGLTIGGNFQYMTVNNGSNVNGSSANTTGGYTGTQDFRSLSWPLNTSWNFNYGGSSMGSLMYMTNPNKPTGWTGYSFQGGAGGSGTVVERYTHDITTVNASGAGITGVNVGDFTSGVIQTLGSITGGSGYTGATVTYTDVPLTGGTGTGATANITVAGGAVTAVSVRSGGYGYALSDTLSAANTNIGGTGSGFSIPVSALRTNVIKTLGSITAGSGYINGTYTNIPLSGGFGFFATGDITVSGGGVTAVVLRYGGYGYVVNDTLSAASAMIGGSNLGINNSGSGFSVTVSAVTASSSSFSWTATSTSGGTVAQQNLTTSIITGSQGASTNYLTRTVNTVAWLYSYNTFVGTRSFSPSGLGITESLLMQADVTTLSLSAVAALTAIATLDNLYDASRYWNTLNSTNIQLPTLGTNIITYNGNQLNLGAYNLTFVNGATNSTLTTTITSGTVNISVTNNYAVGQGVTFSATVGSIVAGTIYYIVAATGTTIQVSAILGGTAITPNASGTPNVLATFHFSGSTITVNAATLATGSKFTTLTTSGTVTLTGSPAINVQYTTNLGTSGILTLTGLQSNSSVYIANASGVQQYFTTTSSTSLTVYSPPAAITTWTWKVAKYGYLPVTGTFISNTNSSQVVTQLTDTVITQATVATVQGYTNLSSLDRLYDYAAYYETTSTGITYTRLASYNAKQISLGAINITTSTSGSALSVTAGTAPTATAITINTGATFAAGTTLTTLITSGSLTIGTGVTIGFVYTTSAGTSSVLQLNGIAVSSGTIGYAYVYVADGSGNVKDYQQLTGSTTTYSLAVAPGATGTWSWKVAQYGKLSASGTLTPGTGGTFTTTVSMATDSGITNTTVSVSTGVPQISSATALTSLDNIYDYGAYYETTSPGTIGSAATGGIAYNRITSQSTTQITIGAASFTYSNATSALWVVAGTLPTATSLTINKGTTLVNGTTFLSLKTTSTATFTSTTNNAIIYSSSGNSGIVQIMGLTLTFVYLQDNTGTQKDYTASAISTTYTYYTPIGSTGTWTWVVKRPGYGYSTGTITPATGGLFTAAPLQTARKNADGTLMYANSTNAFVLASNIAFNGTTEADILIGNGVVSVQNVLDATENALTTNSGMKWLTVNSECSLFISAAGSFIFLSTGWRFAAYDTSSTSATVNGFAISTDSQPLSSTVTSYASRKVTFLSSSQAADVAAAVWAVLTTSGTATPGTMGALLNDADLQAKLAAALSA